jgi:hypothetical protein
MTDTNPPADRIAEIRARLEAATPGPWKAQEYDENPGDEGCAILGNTTTTMRSYVLAYSLPYPWHDREATERDAELIANAPTDLAYLLARVEELERQLGKGEEEWSIRVFTRADQTRWFHQWADADAPEESLASTMRVAAGSIDPGTDEAPVNHGFAVVKRTVWSSEWETVKTVAATGEPTVAPESAPADFPLGHEFKPVMGHPDDDECTFRSDGTDLTYCGEPRSSHERIDRRCGS